MALALACKSFLLQKAYSKGTRHEVQQPLQFMPMWNSPLNTCWPRPHLSWRNAYLAILRVRRRGSSRFDNFSPQNGLEGKQTSKTTPPPIWQVREFVIQCNYQSVLTSFSWSKDNSIKSWHRISWKTYQFQFLHKKRELLWWSRTSSDKVAIVSQAQIWFKRWLLNTLYNPNYVLLINSQSKHQ